MLTEARATVTRGAILNYNIVGIISKHVYMARSPIEKCTILSEFTGGLSVLWGSWGVDHASQQGSAKGGSPGIIVLISGV